MTIVFYTLHGIINYLLVTFILFWLTIWTFGFNFSHFLRLQFSHAAWRNFFMNLNSVIIPIPKRFLIMMNNEVFVVIVISKTFKFEKRSQYKSQSFRPSAFFEENMTIALRIDQHYAVTKWRGYEMTIIPMEYGPYGRSTAKICDIDKIRYLLLECLVELVWRFIFFVSIKRLCQLTSLRCRTLNVSSNLTNILNGISIQVVSLFLSDWFYSNKIRQNQTTILGILGTIRLQ